ncbi:hypothetical protein THAOC_29040, partial [Thalassiosira oceanica]
MLPNFSKELKPDLPGPHRHINADGQGVDARRHVAFRSRAGPSRVVCGAPVHEARANRSRRPVQRASEKKRFDPTNRSFRVDLSPEKDLQHRLEVLALATDGEESCPMEGRRWRLPHRVFPTLLEGEYANVTERGDLRLRPRMGRGSRGRPLDTTGRAVPLTGFPRGFLEEGSRPRIAAAH